MSLAKPQKETLQIWHAMFCFATQPKTKYISNTFRGEESLQSKKQSCISCKIGWKKYSPFIYLFVLIDASSLNLTLQKWTMNINFFWLLTHFQTLWQWHHSSKIWRRILQYWFFLNFDPCGLNAYTGRSPYSTKVWQPFRISSVASGSKMH